MASRIRAKEGVAQTVAGNVGAGAESVSATVFEASSVGPRGVVFFFFQAEDGIRDVAVTGVQTCALPISRGHNNAGVGTAFNPEDFLTNLYSADATLRWKPLRRAIYHSFLLRNEFFWSARDQLPPLQVFETQHAFGMYSYAEYRLNRRWTAGGRFDRSGRATNANQTDTGFSSILTYC